MFEPGSRRVRSNFSKEKREATSMEAVAKMSMGPKKGNRVGNFLKGR